MYPIEIEDWEQESGHFLQKGKKIKNLNDNSQYEIEKIGKEHLSLKPIPFFKNQPGQSFEISYEELLRAFEANVLIVEGFEAGQVRELKIAISSAKRKITNAENDSILREREKELTDLRREKEEKSKIDLQSQQDRQYRQEEAIAMEGKLMEIEILLND